MYSLLISLLAFGITCLATPNPTSATSSPTTTPFFYAPVTLTFHGGPASYAMNFPADDQERLTGTFHTLYLVPCTFPPPLTTPLGNALDVSVIDTNGFEAYLYCNFYTEGYKPIRGIAYQDDQLVVGPPQGVFAVQCANWPGAPSTCLPEYSEWSSPFWPLLAFCPEFRP
jgi:hypothetical protein